MTPTPAWLQEKLFERRIVFVTGRLNDALAGQAAAQIMTLDACGDDPIDVVDAAHTTVRVHCHGRVAGPAHGAGDAAVWRFQARLAKATGRPAEDIADDMRRGRYLDARAALAYGLIDAIRG